MRARKYIVIERKSFDIVLEGVGIDLLRITENGRKRRNWVSLNLEESGWLVQSWQQLWMEEAPDGWFRRWRNKDRSIVVQIQRNRWGRMMVLTEINARGSRTLVIPEGVDGMGWKMLSRGFKELYEIARTRDPRGRLQPNRVVGDRRGNFQSNRMERGNGKSRRQSYECEIMPGGESTVTPCRVSEGEITIKVKCPFCSNKIEGSNAIVFSSGREDARNSRSDTENELEVQHRVKNGKDKEPDSRGAKATFRDVVVDGDAEEDETQWRREIRGGGGNNSNFEFLNGGPHMEYGPQLGPLGEERNLRIATCQMKEKVAGPHSREMPRAQNVKFRNEGPAHATVSCHTENQARRKGREARREDKEGQICGGGKNTKGQICMPEKRENNTHQIKRVHRQQEQSKFSRVYRRKMRRDESLRVPEKGIHIGEGSSFRKKTNSREWVEKMKGVQRNEVTLQTDNSSEEEIQSLPGECSSWFEENPLAMVPADGVVSKEEAKEFEIGDFGDFEQDILRGITVEERASQWILDNSLNISKAIGLSYEGEENETLRLFECIEEGRTKNDGGRENQRTVRGKGSRELKNLRSEVNYDGKGSGVVSSRVRMSKRKGSKNLC